MNVFVERPHAVLAPFADGPAVGVVGEQDFLHQIHLVPALSLPNGGIS